MLCLPVTAAAAAAAECTWLSFASDDASVHEPGFFFLVAWLGMVDADRVLFQSDQGKESCGDAVDE